MQLQQSWQPTDQHWPPVSPSSESNHDQSEEANTKEAEEIEYEPYYNYPPEPASAYRSKSVDRN